MGTITFNKLKKFAQGDIFIETGSMEGWTFFPALEYGFKMMYGIELDRSFYDFSKNLLKGHDNIQLLLGESPDILQDICPSLTEQATFWLDAHASGPNIRGGKYGGCPLVQELAAISLSPIKNHVLMIDDVRLFGSSEWDFLKKQDVIDAIYKINPDYMISYTDGEDDGSFPNDILIARV